MPLERVQRENPGVLLGGRYTPPDCTPAQTVAVIIPFRHREHHLRYWLHYLHPMLRRQRLRYGVYVINQVRGPGLSTSQHQGAPVHLRLCLSGMWEAPCPWCTCGAGETCGSSPVAGCVSLHVCLCVEGIRTYKCWHVLLRHVCVAWFFISLGYHCQVARKDRSNKGGRGLVCTNWEAASGTLRRGSVRLRKPETLTFLSI